VSTALPPAGGADGLWLDVYAANALSRVGGLGECWLLPTCTVMLWNQCASVPYASSRHARAGLRSYRPGLCKSCCGKRCVQCNAM